MLFNSKRYGALFAAFIVATSSGAVFTQAASYSTAAPVPAANSYSMESSGGQLYFILNGVRVQTYGLDNADVSLLINQQGQMVLSFNSQGKSTSVNLGDQRTVQFTGTYRSITADASLGGSVSLIIDSNANVSSLGLRAPVETHIYGTVGSAEMSAAADVIVENGASVAVVRMSHAQSILTANGTVKTVEKSAGSVARGSGIVQTAPLGSTGNTGYDAIHTEGAKANGLKIATSTPYNSKGSFVSNNGGIRLVASQISSDYNESLGYLSRALQNNVRAYDQYTGAEISGNVYWSSSEGNTVTSTGTYSYVFESNNSRYGTAHGTVRINVRDSSRREEERRREEQRRRDNLREQSRQDIERDANARDRLAEQAARDQAEDARNRELLRQEDERRRQEEKDFSKELDDIVSDFENSF